jgi:inorganic pyrophosphatase
MPGRLLRYVCNRAAPHSFDMDTGTAKAMKSLPPFDGEDLNVIIDTPRNSHNKYKFDEKTGLYKLAAVLTAGHSFPFDFGSIPGTKGDDGDALDVLVLMEEPVFVGCLVPCRLIGGIAAEQTEKGRTERNDRLLAVARKSVLYGDVKTLENLNGRLLDQIEHFFISYNRAKGNGRDFKPLERFGPEKAVEIISQGTVQE